MDDILPGLIESRAKVYYTMGVNAGVRSAPDRLGERPARPRANQGGHSPLEIVALEHVLHDMRLFKSSAELDLMREVGAHRRARARTRHAPLPSGPERI